MVYSVYIVFLQIRFGIISQRFQIDFPPKIRAAYFPFQQTTWNLKIRRRVRKGSFPELQKSTPPPRQCGDNLEFQDDF
jgi:hypothetical protein